MFGIDYGHAEVRAVFGKDPREYGVMTKRFIGNEETKQLTGIETQHVTFDPDSRSFVPVPGTERIYPCDLVRLNHTIPLVNILNILNILNTNLNIIQIIFK